MLVDDDETLGACLHKWSKAPWLAVDTEFVRERTYYPELCLIQVSDGGEPVVVDMLAIRDPKPLFSLLEHRETIKVLHAAAQDLEIFAHLRGEVPQPIFDTQIAATMLGEKDQISYAALVSCRLGVALDKSLTRTDWSRRPLHVSAIQYAEDDVRHLATLYELLESELSVLGRLEWLYDECTRYADPAQYRTEPAAAWKRLRALPRLPETAQAAAIALAAWRERTAMRANRPRKWILSDDSLYRIAERRPDTLETLGAIASLSPRYLSRYGPALLRILADPDSVPFTLQEARPPTASQKQKLAELRGQVDRASRRLNIPASFLATRAEMERIVRGGCNVTGARLFRGWRRQAAPEFLAWIKPVETAIAESGNSR